MEKDILFLRELQKELREQATDGQASPRFWTIMDYKWEVTDEGHEDRISLYFYDTSKTLTLEEYVEAVLDGKLGGFNEEIAEDLKEMKELCCYSDILNWIEEHENSEYFVIYEAEVSFVANNAFFFTKKEAEEHLRLNSHHYSQKAHTYAMSMWRAPKMEKLMNILEEFDWESLLEKQKR